MSGPISSRDSGRFEIAAILDDAPSRPHFTTQDLSAHFASDELGDELESLLPPHRSMAIQCVLEHRAFRQDPARLSMLAEVLSRFKWTVGHELAARGIEGFRHEFALSEVLLRVVRYAANLYAWQDHPSIGREQRALLREELVLPLVLDIIRQDLADPPMIEADHSLLEIAQQMVQVTGKLAKTGLLKKARGDVVLKWCRVNIMRTTQRYTDATGSYCFGDDLVGALANVKVRAVVFNILLDELADDVQDRELFEVFRQIPHDGDGRIAPLGPARAQVLRAQVWGPWCAYFDLAVMTWNSVCQSLISIVGEEAFAEHAGQLGQDYAKILASMDYALELNATPSFEALVRPGGGELLAHNMNMMAFETFDRMALRRASPPVDAWLRENPRVYQELREINLLLQHNGQLGNSTTTIDAEIDENCIANEVFQRVAKTLGRAICELFVVRGQALAELDMATYRELGKQIQTSIRNTGALTGCFEQWMLNRTEIRSRVSSVAHVVDVESWLSAHDMLLVTSWVYGGDI